MTGKYAACKKVSSRHNILGLRHAKHPQHKIIGRNIKNEVTTTKQAKWRQNSIATDFLGRDRDDNNTRQCCNKNQNRNSIATRKAGPRHQFEEAAQHHYHDQENTVATKIQGRTQETGREIRLLAATETYNKIQNSVTTKLSSRD